MNCSAYLGYTPSSHGLAHCIIALLIALTWTKQKKEPLIQETSFFFWFPVYYLFFGIYYSWNQHVYTTRKKVINQLLPSTFLQPCAYYSLKYIPDKLKEVLERVHGKRKLSNQICSVQHLSR